MRKKYENRINELRKEIESCLLSKKKVLTEMTLLHNSLDNSIDSVWNHHKEFNKKYNGRTYHEWLDFCDEHISRSRKKLEFYESKTKTRIQQNLIPNLVPLALLVIIFLAVGFFVFKPTITGYVTTTVEYNYTQDLDLEISSNSENVWFLEHAGNLKSIKLNGKVSKDGYAQIYVLHNNVKYIIFDSDALAEEGLVSITGLVVLNESNETESIENESIINETAPLTNQSTENITKKIIINLDYKSGTSYDLNDDGIETIDGIIDFTVEDSEFSWDVDISKLCTKWETYSIDNEEINTICYGSDSCCGFINLVPSSLQWDEPFLSAYGQYGASLNNEISAQILYVDYNVSLENPYTDIHNSEWSSLNASFYEGKISFNDVCVDSCLVSGFNETFYTLMFNVSNATVIIDSVDYIISEEILNITPVNITNITIVEEKVQQYGAVIGKPVKWKKTVKLADKSDKVSIELPKDVTNVYVNKIVNETEKEKVVNAKIKTEGVVNNVDDYNLITGSVVAEISFENILPRFFNWFRGITGFVVLEPDNSTELIIEEEVEEIEIEYETPAPEAIEEEISPYQKRVIVSSEVHYTDILTYTYLPIEAEEESVSLYWIKDSGKEIVNFDAYDKDSNGLIDYIEWVTPYLSNQTYEIEIVVLNVLSYPMLGYNWTVSFNTTGTGNLTITASGGTSYSEMFDDNTFTSDDLELKELRCGNEIIFNKDSFNDSAGLYFILEDGSKARLYQTFAESYVVKSLFVEDYNCADTSYHTVKALTPGMHKQEFNFVGQKANASNAVSFGKVTEDVLKKLDEKGQVRVIVKINDSLGFVKVGNEPVDKKAKKQNVEKTIAEKAKKTRNISKEQLEQDFNIIAGINYSEKIFLDINTTKPVEVKQLIDDHVAIEIDSETLAEILESSDIENIIVDEEFSLFTSESINLTKINFVKDIGYSGKNQSICIVDTGLNPAAAGLLDGENVFGYNVINDSSNYSDVNGHGTKVTYPSVKIASDSMFYIAKVIQDNGIGYASDIIAGLEYCEANNVSVISMSIGGGGYEGYCEEDIVAQKVNSLANNTLVVAATGNDGSNLVKSPACASGALAVASSTKNDAVASFSNYNNATLLVAPGESIDTVDNFGQSVVVSGTSMSVPFVSGAAALILENKTMNASGLKELLIHTGDLINNSQRLFSRLNAWNALTGNITNNLTAGNLSVYNGTAETFTPLAAVSPIEPVARVNITPSTAGSWQSVDLSSYIPEGAEGICFEVVMVPLPEVYWGIRMGGSTDNRYGGNEDQSHHWGCIGVNSTRHVDIIVENISTVIDLVGYIPDGYGEFLSNAVDHSTDTLATWEDVNVSADFSGGTCAVAFLEVDAHETVTASSSIGFRVNGRTNTVQYFDLYAGMAEETTNFGMMGLDSNEIFEQQIENTTMDVYVVGCLYAGDGVHVETDTDPTEYSTGTTGSYQDTTITIAQADNATGVFFTNYCGGAEWQHAVRKNGDTTDYWGNYDMKWGAWGWVETDASQVIEQRIENIACDLWVWGWTYPVTAGGADASPNVTLSLPADASTDADGNISFQCNVTDDYDIANVTLYTNISGSFISNQTIALPGSTDTSYSANFTINNTAVGVHIWNCLAYDNASNDAWAANNFTFTVAAVVNQPPALDVIINSTPDNLNLTTSTLNMYNVSQSDAEGDEIFITKYQWYNSSDGSTYTIVTNVNDSSLSSDNTSAGQYYIAEITISDGTDTNASNSTSLEILATYNLNITDPTTSDIMNVSIGDNITIGFIVDKDGVQQSTGVTLHNVTINNTFASIITNAGGGAGAVAVNSVTNATGTGANITFSHTPAGNNRMLLVSVGMGEGDSSDISSVTFNGVAMSLLCGAAFGVDSDAGVAIYNYTAPAATTANVIVSFSTAPLTGSAVAAVSFTGVDQDNPLGTCVAEADNSVDVSSASNELVFDTAAAKDQTISVGAGQTQRWYHPYGGIGGVRVDVGVSTEPGDTTVTMSWTGATTEYAMAAVPIKPAAGGGGDNQFGYNGSYWTVNVTVPTISAGTYDLFVNATIEGNITNETQYNSIHVDSCVYTGSADWNISAADSCVITANTDLGGNDISITGAGTATINGANLTNFTNLLIEGTDTSNKAYVYCINGGCFRT